MSDETFQNGEELDKLRLELTKAHQTDSLLRRQLSRMQAAAIELIAQTTDSSYDAAQTRLLDVFVEACEDPSCDGTGGPPLAPIVTAELKRLRNEYTEIQSVCRTALAWLRSVTYFERWNKTVSKDMEYHQLVQRLYELCK